MEKINIKNCPCCGSTGLYKTTGDLLKSDELEKGEVKYIRRNGCGQVIKIKYETFPDYEIVDIDLRNNRFSEYCKKMVKESLRLQDSKHYKLEAIEEVKKLQEYIYKEVEAKNDIYCTRVFFSDILEKMASVYIILLQLQEIYNFTNEEIKYEMAIKIDKIKKH